MNTKDFNIKKYGLHESWRPVLVWLDEARPSFCSHFDVLLMRLDQVRRINAEDPSSVDQSPADPVGEALIPLAWSYEDALREIEGKMCAMAARMEQLFFEEIDRRYGLDLRDNPSEEGYGIVNAYFPNGGWNGSYLDFGPIIELLAHIAGGRSWQEMAVKHIGRMLSMRMDKRDVRFKEGRLVLYGILRHEDNRRVAWDKDTHLQLRRLFSLIAYSLGQEPDFRNLISEDELDRVTRVGYSVPEQVLHLNGLEGFNIYADIVERIVFVVKDEELSRRLADFPERPDGSVSQFICQFFSRVSQ